MRRPAWAANAEAVPGSMQKEQIVFQIEYIFTILFLAMGPLRTIPVFYELTRENDWPYRIRAAVFATLIAGAIIALVAISGVETIQSWHVSVAALDIAIGILLIRSTFSTLSILSPGNVKPAKQAVDSDRMPVSAAALAFSPIAAPTIVTPTGVVTIVLFLLLAQGDAVLKHQIYLVILLMLGLNLVGMLLAGFVVRFVRMTTLAIVGWVFAAMQAALAVEVILSGLKLAGFAPH
jgi:multiple antibiotic resistance protein